VGHLPANLLVAAVGAVERHQARDLRRRLHPVVVGVPVLVLVGQAGRKHVRHDGDVDERAVEVLDVDVEGSVAGRDAIEGAQRKRTRWAKLAQLRAQLLLV
jgi:hypothetical protein